MPGYDSNRVNRLNDNTMNAKSRKIYNNKVSSQWRASNDANDRKYYLKSVQLVDMFPHTPHIETIAVLERDDQ